MRRWGWLIQLLGVCLGLIFAAYLFIGPRWICRSWGIAAGQEAQAYIAAHWDGDTLIVQASPGSLYLRGGFRDDQYVGQEFVTLPAYGVSDLVTPIGRDSLILKNTSNQVIAEIPIPIYRGKRVYLPQVRTTGPPPVYRRYFPLMAK